MKKLTGSYYTPPRLAQFILKHAAKYLDGRNHISLLEPSVGDGAFVQAIVDQDFDNAVEVDLSVVEIDSKELEKAASIAESSCRFSNLYSRVGDFLSFSQESLDRFDLIVGNPPYIRKKHLSDEIIKRCEDCHAKAGLSANKINNIWTSFVVSSEA